MNAPAGDLSTIDDLIARATLEPTLVDVYVEGRRDADLVRLILAEAGVEVSVYPISDRLYVRSEETLEYSNDYGNRAKLITAASRVDAALGALNHMYSFIVDSDWAFVVGPQPVGETSLLLTDGPSMEHYFLESDSFQQVLSIGLERSQFNAEDVRRRLLDAMRDVASARLVLQDLSVPCIPKVALLCDFDRNPSTANAAEIVRKSLNAVSRTKDFSAHKVPEQVIVYRDWLDEAGHAGRGHDIAPLLASLLGLKGDFAKTSVVEAIIRSSVGMAELLGKPLFQKLLRRVTYG